MKQQILETLANKILVCDGAMGTMLYGKGIYINRCFDELNITNPNLVSEIHNEYIEAGADIIETNTFGANSFKLKPYGLENKLEEINYRAVEIAKKASKNKIFVAGSIGPLGVKIEPFGRVSAEEARKVFSEQVEILYKGGVDLFILETFPSIHYIKEAVTSVRKCCTLPIIAQVTLNDDGNTYLGETPENVIKELSSLGVDVIGANCSVGPKIMFDTLERMSRVSDRYLSAQPNAGMPKIVEDRLIYLSSPEYFEEYAKRFATLGVKIIGGCCGTTPAHIKSIVRAVRSVQPRISEISVEIQKKDLEKIQIVRELTPTLLARKIAGRSFVISVEIDPPRGWNVERVLATSKYLKENGVDAINIADGPRASARMSPMALAQIIQSRIGIEAILHYCCRDRNILGMQSDILGASALGINNLLLITGDPPKIGDYPDATAVFDVDSIGLTKIVRNLNVGLDIAGNEIGDATSFFIGVGANPVAQNLDEEIRRLQLKVTAGAQYIMTQPIFELERFFDFYKRISDLKIPVIAGILPLVSFRNAEFLHNEVPGIVIPNDIMIRMKNAQTAEAAREEGIKIARESLQELKKIAQGAYFMPPFGRCESVIKILDIL